MNLRAVFDVTGLPRTDVALVDCERLGDIVVVTASPTAADRGMIGAPELAPIPLRTTPDPLPSPRRAGLLANTLHEIGEVIAEDPSMMEPGCAPRNCVAPDSA